MRCARLDEFRLATNRREIPRFARNDGREVIGMVVEERWNGEQKANEEQDGLGIRSKKQKQNGRRKLLSVPPIVIP